MSKKFYRFVGKIEDVEKSKIPLQQKQILRSMYDLCKDNKEGSLHGLGWVSKASTEINCP